MVSDLNREGSFWGDECAPSGTVIQGSVKDLVIHENDVSRIGANGMPTRYIFRSSIYAFDGLSQGFTKFGTMAPRDHIETSVIWAKWIQIDRRPHAEESIWRDGIVMPAGPTGMDNPLR